MLLFIDFLEKVGETTAKPQHSPTDFLNFHTE